MAKKVVDSRVCVCFFHPLVLERCQRLLKGMRVLPVRFPLSAITNPTEIAVPRAETYVVDADSSRPRWEMILNVILKQHPDAHILVLGESLEEAIVFHMLRLGVKGLVRYDDAEDQLARAVQMVISGGFWAPRQLLSRLLESFLRGKKRAPVPATYLTPRELVVLDYLIRNLSNKEIANDLAMAERTVKFHVSKLLSKFGVQRRADLILLCFQQDAKSQSVANLVNTSTV